jgi:hypothetical protein
MVDSKHWPDCGHSRSLGDFARDRRRQGGLAFYCRDRAGVRLCESTRRRKGPPRARHRLERHVPDGHTWGPDCESIKPVAGLPRSSAHPIGGHTCCLPCHNARGRASVVKVLGSGTYHLQRRYGISAQDADEVLAAHGGLCAVCRAVPAVRVHHDHRTGAVRALIGVNCTGGLGQCTDDPFRLDMAAFSIEQHGRRQALDLLAESAADAAEVGGRPGTPPVGSQRRTGARGTSSRSTGRSSGARRRKPAGEADA